MEPDTEQIIWCKALVLILCIVIYAKFKYFRNSSFIPHRLTGRIRDLISGVILLYHFLVSLIRLYVGSLTQVLLPRNSFQRIKYREYLARHYQSIIDIVVSGIWLLVFFSGVARYRTLLVVAGYFFLKAIFRSETIDRRILSLLYPPALVIAFAKDIHNGQLFPVFEYHNVLLAIVTLMCAEALIIIGYLHRVLQILSDNAIFRTCPRCKFDNATVVDRCLNCSYVKGVVINLTDVGKSAIIVDAESNNEIERYKDAGAYLYPTAKLMNLIELDTDEHILINIKSFFTFGYYKNDKRNAVSNLLLTTKRIFVIHFLMDSDGWRMKEIISYDKLISATGEMRKHLMRKEPSLILETSSNTYEFAFNGTVNYFV